MDGDKNYKNLEFKRDKKNNCFYLNSLQVFNNNIETAKEVIQSYLNSNGELESGKTILYAKTQSGKTVVSVVSVNMLIEELKAEGYKSKDIYTYYFSNLVSNKLRNQNVDDFELSNVDELSEFNFGHSRNYTKIISELNKLDSSKPQIAVVDESHFGNEKGTSCEKLIDTFSKFDKCFIIYVSATPYSLLAINNLPGPRNYNLVVYKPGKDYIGLSDLSNFKRLRETGDIVETYTAKQEKEGLGKQNELYLTQFGKEIIDLYLYRFEKGIVGNLVLRLIGVKANNIESLINEYMSTKGLEPIDHFSVEDLSSKANKGENKLDKISKKPIKPRVFIVRNSGRAGIRINNKDAISIFVETFSNKDSVVAQSAAGRFTGYGSLGDTLIYTNLEAIKRIIAFEEKMFSDDTEFDSQTWFPSSNELQTEVKVETRYEIVFFPATKKVLSDYYKEKEQFDADRKLNLINIGDKNSREYKIIDQTRFGIETTNDNKRSYKDLLLFINNVREVRSTSIISKSSPLRKRGLNHVNGYINGPCLSNDKLAQEYYTFMAKLKENKVKDCNGNLIDDKKHYIIISNDLPKQLNFVKLKKEDLSDKMSDIL